MKQCLALFLAVLMFLVACNGTVDTSSTSDISSQAEEYTGETRYTLISIGKPYTTSAQPNENYADIFNQQLTDGQKTPDAGVHYTDTRMVGYNSTNNYTIDLGDDGKRISAIAVRCIDMDTDGVKLAATARFSGSVDGSAYDFLGVVPFTPSGDQTVSTARHNLTEVKDYRYIRVLVTIQSGSSFFFMDEIEVYACVPETEKINIAEMAYKNDTTDKNAWKALSTGVAAKPAYTSNIAQGTKYKFENCEFDQRAPQNEKVMANNVEVVAKDYFLTDAAHTGRLFGQDVWVGIKGAEGVAPEITLSLGSERSDIFAVKVHALGHVLDIDYPAFIDVLGSKDGKEYTFLGRMYAPAESSNYAYTLILSEYVNVKNLKFQFPEGIGNYWIEEIEVYAGSDKPFQGGLYPPLDFDEVTELVYWESSEPDYNDEINLILNKPQQIAANFYVDAVERANNSKVDSPYLTDGKRSTNTHCYNGQYFFSNGGGGLDFIFDMGAVSTVSKLNVSLLEHRDWGISRPTHIYAYLSENGDDWYRVAAYDRPADAEINKTATRLEIPLEMSVEGAEYQARYVMFRFESAMLFIDELECFGTKAISDKSVKLSESGIDSVPYYINEESEKYATVENTGFSAEEITITYPNDTTVENLLPILAYIDEEGNIKDTFCDGLLLCYRGELPSGLMPHIGSYMNDWEHTLASTFDDQTGFTVIDQTVATIKETLGLTDYKVTVYASIMPLIATGGEFGDVDGDGIMEMLDNSEDRTKIFQWFTQKTITEFNARNYQNIQLGGFYWLDEAVNYELDDAHIIKECSEVVKATGYDFFWVPYYTAHRYFNGYDYGFDLISMQPNYVFKLDEPYYRIVATPDMTKRLGMTVEIEHTYQCLSDIDFARRYMLYLYYGATEGYMDSVHVYYDDVENFGIMAYSDSKLCRLQYDATYQFAKGTLDITPDKKDDIKLSATANTIFYGNIGEEGEISMYSLVSAPENGRIALNTNGEFAYYPDKDFTGTDKFTYTYNNLLGESEECVVEITVG